MLRCWCSQPALAAVEPLAGLVVYLPLQGPHLDVQDDVRHLQPGLGEPVLAPHRHLGCIDAVLYQPLGLQLLEPLGEDLRRDAPELSMYLGEPHPAPSPPHLEQDDHGPFLGEIVKSAVHRAGLVHAFQPETSPYL